MSLVKKIANFPVSGATTLAVRSMNPSVGRIWFKDISGIRSAVGDSAQHLDETINWLCRAQDAVGSCGGVSTGFSLVSGWLPPYPETTGYIIPTLYDYAAITGTEELRSRALRMAEWEIGVQMENGAVQAGYYNGPNAPRKPAVFNTGQVILGWCRTFLEENDERFLEAAKRAADWLLSVQADDGSWYVPSSETETSVHAYDVRTAWSLLEVYDITKEKKYEAAATRKLEWTLRQQHENGWFDNNSFFVSKDKWTLPLTHTIAYVMEGLLESWRLTGRNEYLVATEKTAEKLLLIFELRRFMAGEFDEKWHAGGKYSCLTGNAQIAGVWLRLFEINKDTRYLNAALKLNDYTKSTQNISSLHGGIRGGIKGSQPIYGRYTPLIYVNWGAKFWADTLMLEEKLMAEFENSVLEGKLLGDGNLEFAQDYF